MASLQLNNILDRLDELRAIFVLGQRALPFLEEMFFYLQDISVLLDDVNDSIRENAGKMPHASMRLESVSQATEMATTEILDLVDAALLSLEQIRAGVEHSSGQVAAITRADARLIRVLRGALRGRDDALLARVERIHQEKTDLRRGVSREIRTDIAAIDAIRSKLHHIMFALQVQDITAQQLAAVNHLIESIRDGMGHLMVRLGAEEGAGEPRPAPRRFAAFDPDADYDCSDARQHQADEVVASFEEQKGGRTAPPDAKPASQDAIDRLFKARGGGVASQEEIDKLFQNGGGG